MSARPVTRPPRDVLRYAAHALDRAAEHTLNDAFVLEASGPSLAMLDRHAERLRAVAKWLEQEADHD